MKEIRLICPLREFPHKWNIIFLQHFYVNFTFGKILLQIKCGVLCQLLSLQKFIFMHCCQQQFSALVCMPFTIFTISNLSTFPPSPHPPAFFYWRCMLYAAWIQPHIIWEPNLGNRRNHIGPKALILVRTNVEQNLGVLGSYLQQNVHIMGEGMGSPSNNLVYTKRQKDIHANRKHETTM